MGCISATAGARRVMACETDRAIVAKLHRMKVGRKRQPPFRTTEHRDATITPAQDETKT